MNVVELKPVVKTVNVKRPAHENWERMGEDAEGLREAYSNGWITVFETGFGEFAGRA